MLGIGEDSRQFEDDEENGDEKKETMCDALMDCCDIRAIWNCKRPHKIWHRLIQSVFTVGLFLLVYAKRQTTGSEDTFYSKFENIIVYLSFGAIAVHVFEFFGAKKLVVRVRAALPDLRRNVNSAYLQNRPNNRYGLVPYVGPIMSGLSAFLNQPPLKEEGKKCRIIPYVANFVTYILFCVGIWLYEIGQSAAALVCVILSGVLGVFDVCEDVSNAMNFAYEKRCGHASQESSGRISRLRPVAQQNMPAVQQY